MRAGDLCLVTGGTGFIGSNLVRTLLHEGMRVRVYDDSTTGRIQNLHDVQLDVEMVEGDVRDPSRVLHAMDRVGTVFHLAAVPGAARSLADPLPTHAANATGTLNALVAARGAEVERVVFASSSAVYGYAEWLPLEETMPNRPISPFGVSKLAGETYAAAFTRGYGLATISLRLFTVFGPYQKAEGEDAGAIARFVMAALDGRAPEVTGDGEQIRDVTFVGDVVQALLLAADAGQEAWGRAFNIGTGQRRTMNEVLAAVQAMAPREGVAPRFVQARPGEVRGSLADISHARAALGFEPRFDFEEGLRITMDHYAAGAPWTYRG